MPPKANGVKVGRSKLHQDSDEDDIKVVNSIISCLDIISRQRIQKCVRSMKCEHMGCFDLQSFCEVNKINPNLYDSNDKENVKFTDRVTRYEVIPIVSHVASKNISHEPEKKFFIKLKKSASSLSLFKVRRNQISLSLAARKLTKKRKNMEFVQVKCPLCNVAFQPNELVYDDFMTTVLKHVPMGIEQIEISEDWVVKLVKEESPFKGEEVVEIDDLDSEEDNGPVAPLMTSIGDGNGNGDGNGTGYNNYGSDSTLSNLSSETSEPRIPKRRRINNTIKVVDMYDQDSEDSGYYLSSDSLDELFEEKFRNEYNNDRVQMHGGTQDDPLVID